MHHFLLKKSGSLAMLAAMRRALACVRSFAPDARRPGFPSSKMDKARDLPS